MIDEENVSKKSRGNISLICVNCGVEFFVYPYEADTRKYCSRKCANSVNSTGNRNWRWNGGLKTYKCGWCGKSFESYPSANRSFCSTECGNEYKSKNYRGENSHSWKGGDITRTCDYCGKEYITPRKGEHITKFCSRECAGKYHSKNIVGENNIQWTPRMSKMCEQCGEEYFIEKWLYDKSRFCSMECLYVWMSENVRGEYHPSWMGGISFLPYCSKFDENFKESIREKYGRRCFICGKSEKENGRKLDVHHVSYRKDCLCDGVKCDFVPLCRSDHTRTNGNRFFWENVITYALGYYDDYYNVGIPKRLLQLNI